MARSQRTVTGPVLLPDGSVPLQGRIVFTLSTWDAETGEVLYVPGPLSVTLDEEGDFTCNLFTNTDGNNTSVYRVSVIHGTDRETVVETYISTVSITPGSPIKVSDLPHVPEWTPPSEDLLATILGVQSAVETQYQQTIQAASSVVGVGTYGAVGNGVTNDQTAFANALAAAAPNGPVYVPWTANHYVLTSLTDEQRSRLWGPGKVLVNGVLFEISRVPRVADDRPIMSIVERNWRPLADFASVDTDDGPFLMDVWRRGTSVGSFSWALFLGTMPDEKPAGVHDHILSVWANPARVTGPSTRTNGIWSGVNTTASNIPGQGGTTGIDGIYTAQENNFGNQKYNAGIRTTFGNPGDVAGLLLVPDTSPSPLGPNYWTVSNITIGAGATLTVRTFDNQPHNFTNHMSFRIYQDVGTLPGGLVNGQVYWIVNVSGDTFQLSTTIGGPPITTTGTFAAGVRGIPSYPAPHALVFSLSVNQQQIGIPIECALDTIQDSGHFMNIKGSSSTIVRPSNFLLLTGAWARGFDATGATITTGIFGLLPDNVGFRWGSSTGAGIRGTTGVLDLSPGGTANGRLLTNGFTGPTAIIQWGSNGLGFNGNAPVARPTITGSKGGNTALASILAALDTMGLVTDATT